MHFLGFIYAMEVCKLLERRLYWRKDDNGMFKAHNYGKIMSLTCFENIMKYLQLSEKDFLCAVNDRLKETLIAGDHLCIDESMVKKPSIRN